MNYSYDEIFTRNPDLINRLIAENVMEEPEPQTSHEHIGIESVAYSEKGWWTCILQYEQGDICKWYPVNFSGSIKYAWQVVSKIRSGTDDDMKRKFKTALELLAPFESSTEAECCRKICRAALLSKLSIVPKTLTKF